MGVIVRGSALALGTLADDKSERNRKGEWTVVQLKRYAWLAVLMVLSLAVLPACNSLTLPGELVASADSAITAAPAVVQPQATDPLAESDVIVALEGRLQDIYAQVNQSVVVTAQAVNSPIAGAPELRPGVLSAELDSEDGAFTTPSGGGTPALLHPQGQTSPQGAGLLPVVNA